MQSIPCYQMTALLGCVGGGRGGLGVDSRPDHTIAETSLPLKHQVTLVKMFGLMGIAARTMLLSLWPI